MSVKGPIISFIVDSKDVSDLNDITAADVLSAIVEGSFDLKESLRLILAVLCGKSSGGGTTTNIYRDMADTKARITATVDTSGNRTAVTRDET